MAAFLPFKMLLPPPPSERKRNGQKKGKYWSLPQDQCAICAENASFNLNIADPANAFTTLAAGPYQSSVPSASHVSAGFLEDAEPSAYPIYNPYVTSCGDLYCYHCITERMMRVADDGEDDGWQCLRCMEIVKSAERHTVQLKSDIDTRSDSEFSSDLDMDVNDISGSVEDYSE